MALSDYLLQLRDPDTQVSSEDLAQLSGLLDDELDDLVAGWEGVPPLRRGEVVARLVQLAEENAELDFQAVFCHALQDEEPMVRERAVSGLWESDDRRVIPMLIERLESDVDDTVRAVAALVLGHFAALAEAGKLVPRDTNRITDALMRSLEDDDEPFMVRRRALESVASLSSADVQTWIKWGYDHSEVLLRQSALYAMGRSGDPVWLEIIHGEMESDDPAMRYEAAQAARELCEQESLPHLAELVEDLDMQISTTALHAIAFIGGARARSMLRGYVQSAADTVVQEAAEEALAMLEADVDDLAMLRLEREMERGAVEDEY
jgi:HEAT repeat protein